ncbi:MAG: nuclear transport factor 2 family protein [Acidobacteria bacterium]|nr:nuclear transport factor 2 family protein [Acidobacteriota bacterium]
MRMTVIVLAGALLLGAGWTAGYAVSGQTAADPKIVADKAFEGLTQGLATGKWDGFFALLADDFTFWFPTGKYLGQHQGKAQAIEFFSYVSSAFPQGLRVTEVMRRSGSGQTFVYEFRDEGSLRGEPYKNRVAISLDVCGDKICGYREYFGSDGKTN